MPKTQKRFIKADDTYNLITVEDPQWSPDGKQVAFVRLEMERAKDAYKRTLWRWESGWDEPRQFTNSGKLDYSPQYDPKGGDPTE